jgi:hypothetical protein
VRWLTFYAAVFACGYTALTTTSITVAYGMVLTATALLMRAARPLMR